MKIISWNCNRAFRKKINAIVKYQPDILVVQECEDESRLKKELEKIKYNQLIWFGDNPHKGIATISFNDYKIELKPNHDTSFRFIIPIKVSKSGKSFTLYNIWAMPNKTDRSKSYVGQIWGAVHHYQEDLNAKAILVGDFNSNVIWDKPNRNGNHSNLVNFLEQRNIKSLYHVYKNEKQGQESQPTLFLLKQKEKPYHIDYCFASQDLFDYNTNVYVGQYKDWISLSDHMPIFIDNIKF